MTPEADREVTEDRESLGRSARFTSYLFDGNPASSQMGERRSWEDTMPEGHNRFPEVMPPVKNISGSFTWTREQYDWWQPQAEYYQRQAAFYHKRLKRRGAQQRDPWLIWKYELARSLSLNPPEQSVAICYGAPGWSTGPDHPENKGIPLALNQWPDGVPIHAGKTPTGEQFFFDHYASMPEYPPKVADKSIIQNPAHVFDFIHCFCGTNLIEECAGDTVKTALLLKRLWNINQMFRDHANASPIKGKQVQQSGNPLPLYKLGARPFSSVVNDMIHDFIAAERAFTAIGYPRSLYEFNCANVLTDEYYEQDFFARCKASGRITTILLQGNTFANFTPEQRRYYIAKHKEVLPKGKIRFVISLDCTTNKEALERTLDHDVCNQIVVNGSIFGKRNLGMKLPGEDEQDPFRHLGARREFTVIKPDEHVMFEIFVTDKVRIPDPANPGQTKLMDVEMLAMRRENKSIGRWLEELRACGTENLSILHADLPADRYPHVNHNWLVQAA